MKLYIARHGETELNLRGDRYQGSLDLPLNSTGLLQAAALENKLPSGIDVIICSPLLRARQTAQAIAKVRGLSVQEHSAFRERDFGCFEGLSLEEALVMYPHLPGREALEQWDDAPPGAETVGQVVRRVSGGLREISCEYENREVLLVAHGFVARAVRHLLNLVPVGEFFREPKIANGEFISFDSVTVQRWLDGASEA